MFKVVWWIETERMVYMVGGVVNAEAGMRCAVSWARGRSARVLMLVDFLEMFWAVWEKEWGVFRRGRLTARHSCCDS